MPQHNNNHNDNKIEIVKELVKSQQEISKIVVLKKGKRKRRKRTSVDGHKPHSHLYSRGDKHTEISNGHKHKISKNNKTALAGKTGHSHKLKNPY